MLYPQILKQEKGIQKMVPSRPRPSGNPFRFAGLNGEEKRTRTGPGGTFGSRLAGALLSAALVLTAGVVEARGIPDQFDIPSRKSELAKESLLLDVTRAGNNIVAVGIKGHILVSRDGGKTWEQGDVPVITNLNAVHFVSEQKGWAVGHDQVILHTRDGGSTWEMQHSNIKDDDPNTDVNEAWNSRSKTPLMDVYFANDAEGWAVGAYGMMLKTTNGGRSWKRVVMPNLDPNREEWDPVELEFHLNAITATPNGEIYIAGEAGTVYRSPDMGQSWEALITPYSGSFYGIVVTNKDVVIAFGLRGNMFSSKDKGQIWKRVDSQTDQTLLGAAYSTQDDTMLLVGTKGAVLYSGDGGQRFDIRTRKNRIDMVAATTTADGNIAIVGFGGVELLKATGGEL